MLRQDSQQFPSPPERTLADSMHEAALLPGESKRLDELVKLNQESGSISLRDLDAAANLVKKAR